MSSLKNTSDKKKPKKFKKSRVAVANAASQKAYKQYIQQQDIEQMEKSNSWITRLFLIIGIILCAIIFDFVSGITR